MWNKVEENGGNKCLALFVASLLLVAIPALSLEDAEAQENIEGTAYDWGKAFSEQGIFDWFLWLGHLVWIVTCPCCCGCCGVIPGLFDLVLQPLTCIGFWGTLIGPFEHIPNFSTVLNWIIGWFKNL